MRRAWTTGASGSISAPEGGCSRRTAQAIENYTLEALFNLRDFAEDPILRRKADMFLDLFSPTLPKNVWGSVRGGPKTSNQGRGL